MITNVAALIPIESRRLMLSTMLNMRQPEDQLLKLYKNDISPSETDVSEDFVEATYPGYQSILLYGAEWVEDTVEHEEFGTCPQVSYDPQVFMCTNTKDQAPEKIYGYYIVQEESNLLLWAVRFKYDTVYYMGNDGDSLTISPSMLFR